MQLSPQAFPAEQTRQQPCAEQRSKADGPSARVAAAATSARVRTAQGAGGDAVSPWISAPTLS